MTHVQAPLKAKAILNIKRKCVSQSRDFGVFCVFEKRKMGSFGVSPFNEVIYRHQKTARRERDGDRERDAYGLHHDLVVDKARVAGVIGILNFLYSVMKQRRNKMI